MRAQNRPSRSGLNVRELIVSGFLISPKDQDRMRSGEARPIWIWSNDSGLATGFAKLVSSFIVSTFLSPSSSGEGLGWGMKFHQGEDMLQPSTPSPEEDRKSTRLNSSH